MGGVPAQAEEGRGQGGRGGGREGGRQGGEGGGEGVMACRLSRNTSREYQVNKIIFYLISYEILKGSEITHLKQNKDKK